MRIAVLGAGQVGRSLGERLVRLDHIVRYGVPDPTEPKYADLGPDRVTTVGEAAQGAETVVLATPWPATEEALRTAGDLAGKVVIDCTNPLAMNSDGLGLAVGYDRSGGEMVAEWATGASVFKTLNQTGAENMADPSGYTNRPAMFVAGDDPGAKPRVMSLVEALGFEAVDAGPLRNARLLEPLAMLWIDLALKRGLGRGFALSITRR